MASYREEARLLDLDDFPPLRRTVEAIQQAGSRFFGLSVEGTLAAVAEVDADSEPLDLSALVVHPDFFRRGLATGLLRQLLEEEFPDRAVSVTTGAANGPAIQLYEKLGFRLVDRWDHGEGIPMVTFHRPGEEESLG
jgi:ribosomal protein S18 acetylase RimI-like enzyme